MTVRELSDKLIEYVRNGDGGACVTSVLESKKDDVLSTHGILYVTPHGYHNGKLLNLHIVVNDK